jgi:hypothetical protein
MEQQRHLSKEIWRVIDQSKADIFIKPGIMMMIIAFCLLSLNLGVGVFNTGRTSDQRKR